jgi:hypothetical protein
VPMGQSGGGRPPERSAAPAAGRMHWLLPVLPLLLAAIVHRRALGAFFSTDDFVRLEEAAGLLPSAPTLWRLVSEVLYVKLMLGLFGPKPLPFHIVSLALHLVNTALVYRMGRKAGLTAAASCFASAVFGAFPLFYTALLSAVNINDILALTFVFLALAALEAPTPVRSGVAVACFAIALLSKEAVLAVPFAAVLLPLSGESMARTVRRLSPLLITGVVFAALYLMFRTRGLGTGGYAYAVGFGVHIVHNLMTYAVWSVDLLRPVPDAIGNYDAAAWKVGVWPLAALALAAALSRSRRRAILFGSAWWLLGLAPVLPLLSHTYGHYLYVPMAGFALAGAAAIEALVAGIARVAGGAARAPAPARAPRAGDTKGAPRPRAQAAPVRGGRGWPALATAAFVVLAIGFAVRSEFLLRARVHARLGSTQLALDPFTRKMEVAVRALSTLSGQLDRARDSVVVFTPPGLGRTVSATTGLDVAAVPAGVAYYDVVERVLGGGLTVRLFEPRLDSVVFVNRWTPDYREFNLFTEGPGGRLVKMGRGPRAHDRLASLLLGGGYHAQAREYLGEVVRAYPGDRGTRLLYAVALSGTGEVDSARAHARLLVEGAPPDTVTALARKVLSVLGEKK